MLWYADAVQRGINACAAAASPLFVSHQGRLSQTSNEGLKRLAFVETYSGFCFSKGCNLASSVYNTSLAYTPARVHSSVRAVEGVISDYTVPVVTAVQNNSRRALYQIDNQVQMHCCVRPCQLESCCGSHFLGSFSVGGWSNCHGASFVVC